MGPTLLTTALFTTTDPQWRQKNIIQLSAAAFWPRSKVGSKHKVMLIYTTQVFWDVTPCHWVAYDISKRRSAFIFKGQAIILLWPLASWRWGHYDLSKRREPHTLRHSVTLQNTWILDNTAVRTSDLGSVEVQILEKIQFARILHSISSWALKFHALYIVTMERDIHYSVSRENKIPSFSHGSWKQLQEFYLSVFINYTK